MYNPRLKSKESLVDMSTYGTDSRKRMHSTVLIGDHCEYHPMFKEGDILDANATLNLIQDTYDENKIFETFSEEGRQIAERLDRIESISDENNTQIVNEITEIDNKFSTQTENIRNDINSILQLIPELKRVVDINLVSNNDGKKTYLVEKQNGELSYIEITDGEKGDPFVYNDFTQEQLESLKVKGDKGDKGDRGISVAEVKQTKLSYADKGENIWRMTLNDGTISEFVVRNGSGAEYVGTLEQGISTESTRARDAEAALQLNINLLALQQQQDVQRLSTEIDTKISDVIGTAPAALDTLGEIATKLAYNDDAVTSIVSAISTETTNRQQSESILLNNIDAVSTALNNLDQTLTSRIGTEESRALLAERLISSDLVTLSGIVNTNNTDLSSGLSTEQSRAEAAETALNLAITQEVSDRQTAISEETTRALTVEASLQSDITVEYQRASTAENTLDGKIDLEISDRQSAISDLSNNKADKATTIAGYGITNAYTKTEVDSLIQTEENRATAAEQAVAGDLSNEITRATTAEQTISGNLSDEITRATTAEQANATAIQNEITRATAAELANAAAIQANTTAFNSFKDSIKTDGTLGTTITSTERTSWNNKVDGSSVGVANGVATLDSGGKIPSSQLPSYVDDVEEYLSLSNFPTTGESGKIYVDTTTNLTYRWSGSTYVAISSDLALGETSSTAYAGDKGKALADKLATIAEGAEVNVQPDWNAVSGDAAILNKPTIPTVGNGTLTILKNGANVKSFTANQSTDVTANITVPTKVSELTNDSGYTTNIGTITGITMNGSSKGTSGVVNLGTVITAHLDISGKADKATTLSGYGITNAYTKTEVDALTRHTRKTDFDLATLKLAVADQNLEKYGLKVGDEKTINGHTYVIAGLNPMIGTSTPFCVTQNHVGLIVIPHITHAWNSDGETTAVANGHGAGYANSELHAYLKSDILPMCNTDLGAANLIGHTKWLTNTVNATGNNRFGNATGCSSYWKLESACKICALSEMQVYGATIWSSSGYDTGEACRLLDVFQKYRHTEIFGREYPWLRDVVSATYAASVGDTGKTNYNLAYTNNYVAALILFN